MRRIKSFTVLELIIVLVLTGTVVAMAYSGASLFFKEFIVFSQRSDNAARVSLLNRLFFKDIDRSAYISIINENVTFVKKDKTVLYKFNPDYIIRKDSMVVDTFRFSPNNLNCLFNGNEVKEGIIDQISFSFLHNEDSIKFEYKKKYDADTFMNYLNTNK